MEDYVSLTFSCWLSDCQISPVIVHLQSPDIDAFAIQGLAASRTIHEKWQLHVTHVSNISETIGIDHAMMPDQKELPDISCQTLDPQPCKYLTAPTVQAYL